MISQTAEYALRAMVCLAQQPDQAQTTQQIAEQTRVRPAYLSKVLQALGRAGLVQAQRGIHGGFELVRSPDQVSILEVINAVDPFKRIQTCPLGIPSHGNSLCALHRKIDNAMGQIEEAFGSTSLQQLLDEDLPSPPLCPVRIGSDKRP